jgi:hypothetical protein
MTAEVLGLGRTGVSPKQSLNLEVHARRDASAPRIKNSAVIDRRSRRKPQALIRIGMST